MFERTACFAVAAFTGSAVLLPGGAAVHGASRTGAVVIAHRGASAYAPENTLSAVRRARDLGAEWVENDVQRTRDGQLVVIHDTTLERTTDAEDVYPDRSPWRVADFTLAEIRRLDAGGWFGTRFTGERVPTLRSYLGVLDRTGQKLLLEIKDPELYPGIETQIAAELDRDGWLAPGHVDGGLVVQSFSADALKSFHRAHPAVSTGYLGAPPAADLTTWAGFSDQINAPYKSATAAYVASVHQVRGAHGKPLEVNAWTVNDGATARRLLAAGVDGLISNKPDTVLEAAREEADAEG